MGDFANISNDKLKKLQVETTVSRKTIVKKYQKASRTVRRKNRRRRSRKAYFKSLKRKRVGRVTEDLCADLQEFSVIDMEMSPMCDLNKLPEEITEWQKQDQIAYWKSRAITLEIENRMLHEHLRNVYAQQIEYYEKNQDWKEIPSTQDKEKNNVSQNPKKTNSNKSSSSSNKTNTDNESTASTSKDSGISDKMKDLGKVLPKILEGKNRLEEMKKIYGDTAQKIMGMETAIQLNYERLTEDSGAGYWPNIGIRL